MASELSAAFGNSFWGKKQFLFIVFLIQALALSAQDRFFYLGQPYIYKDSVLLDQSRLNLIYRHEFRIDTSTSPMWSNVKMQVGRKVVKQTDLHVYFTNLWRKISEETPGIVPDREQAELISNGNCNHPYFAEMTMFPSENALRITCCNYLLGSHSGPFVYDESIPEMEWQLLDGADSVAGYACKIAQTHFRGRVWKAWYTLQIPIPTGPWKLHGLPGIILRAVDQTGTYSFECIGIETDPQSIYEYVPMRSTAVTRTQYLRYERRYHEDPQSVRGDAADIFKLGQDGVTNIDTDWQIPYYPIEFE